MRRQVIRIAQGLQPTVSRRFLQINTYPPTLPTSNLDSADNPSTSLAAPTSGTSPDARFEVLGSNSSLLSVALLASQNLFTRRGSLVGVSGSPDHAVSVLSPLSPLTRAAVGIPFLYQKITSTTPLTLLIGTKAANTSISVIHLDGRQDWVVAQRKGLVAWTGHTLNVRPSVNLRMSVSHWGNTHITGRGLVALTGTGQIYQVTLNAGDEYVAHPSNILAYTMTENRPSPYRFKSTSLRLQLPSLGEFLNRSKFLRAMQTTQTWKYIANFIYTIRRFGRSTLLGDRLFLHFRGPQTILLQSRGSTIRDSLTAQDIDEVADAPAGVVYGSNPPAGADATALITTPASPTTLSYASIDRGRRVSFKQDQ